MKALVVGDIHMRQTLPYSELFQDGRKTEWTGVLDKIVETAALCDNVFLLGDVLNSRHNHSSVIRELVEFLKRFGNKDIYIISGNHCTYGLHTALDFLQKLGKSNWHVYTTITQAVQLFPGITATFIPYTLYATLGVATKEEAEKALIESLAPADVSFSHHAFAGGKSTEFFGSEIVLDTDKMSKLFGISFFGHIHKAERLSPNVQGTGSVFTQEVGEYGKSIWVWNSDTKTTEEVPLPVRGIYKIVWEEGVRLDIPDHSIVKCYVTDKGTDIETVRNVLQRFDASIIVEQYPNERAKMHFEDGGLDLSVEGLLKLYSDAKGLEYSDVMGGFELIR